MNMTVKKIENPNAKKLLVEFVTVFSISLFVSVTITLVWNLIFHGTVTIDWETSFRFATLFGITFPLINVLGNKRI
jgi:hypothetical protein